MRQISVAFFNINNLFEEKEKDIWKHLIEIIYDYYLFYHDSNDDFKLILNRNNTKCWEYYVTIQNDTLIFKYFDVWDRFQIKYKDKYYYIDNHWNTIKNQLSEIIFL